MGDVSVTQGLLVALSALAAGTIGGVAGYGTGLLMPLVLASVVDPALVVPIIGLSALFTNASRILAFRHDVDWRKAFLITCAALPTCIIGAYGYTFLTGRGASIIIGAALLLLVPARRALKRLRAQLTTRGTIIAGSGYGLLIGGTAGSGIVLLSILMSTGLSGRAVVATDAAISLALSLVKTSTFQVAGALPASAWAMAILVGLAATPGAFIAKQLTKTLPVHIHDTILDGAVLVGGAILLVKGLS